MRDRRSEFSALFLIVAGIASVAMSVWGFLAVAWGGFWNGPSAGDVVLSFFFWFLPILGVVVFGIYFLARRLGLICSWAISIGSWLTLFIMSLKDYLAGKSTAANPIEIALVVFVLPQVWVPFVASIALYLAGAIANNTSESAQVVSQEQP